MTTETMTIHEALAELKVINNRISKAIGGCRFAVANKHCNTKIDGKEILKFCDEQASSYQSAVDLINRRNAIKRAVTKSNATAIVNVCGVEYTVAEAIDMKNNGTDFMVALYEKMSRDLSAANMEMTRRNGDELQARADAHIKNIYGNQTDVKNVVGDIKETRDEFISQQTYDLVQPTGMDVAAEMKKLEEETTNFLMKVDAALSVSNATTVIEISY